MIKSQSVPVDSGTGSFSVGNLMVGNYTLTPSADGFQFDPSSLSISPLSSNKSGLDFMGVATGIQTENSVFDPTKGGKVTFYYSVLDGHVSLRIRTLRGAPLRTVVDEDKSMGAHMAEWDGKDESGRPVASGVYLVLFNAPQFESIEKVVVVK
jgi:flagellar hook assembly protein FlgD